MPQRPAQQHHPHPQGYHPALQQQPVYPHHQHPPQPQPHHGRPPPAYQHPQQTAPAPDGWGSSEGWEAGPPEPTSYPEEGAPPDPHDEYAGWNAPYPDPQEYYEPAGHPTGPSGPWLFEASESNIDRGGEAEDEECPYSTILDPILDTSCSISQEEFPMCVRPGKVPFIKESVLAVHFNMDHIVRGSELVHARLGKLDFPSYKAANPNYEPGKCVRKIPRGPKTAAEKNTCKQEATWAMLPLGDTFKDPNKPHQVHYKWCAYCCTAQICYNATLAHNNIPFGFSREQGEAEACNRMCAACQCVRGVVPRSEWLAVLKDKTAYQTSHA